MSSSTSSSGSSRPSSPDPAPSLPRKRKRKDGGKIADAEIDNDDSDSSQSEADDAEDVPALSHAERRRQKKREDRALKNAVASAAEGDSGIAAKKRKTNDGAAVASASSHKKEKRQNSVWIGNLSFKTAPDDLRGFFDGVGEITRIHMPTKAGAAKGENMGFAYVDFASPDHKIIAISLSEREFQGRRLLIKDGGDFTGRPAAVKAAENADSADPDGLATTTPKTPGTGSTGMSKTAQKILRIQKQPPAPTLFLGNLGFETTDKSIRELFEAHRGVKKKDPAAEDEDDRDRDAATDKDAEKPEVKDKWIRKIRMGTFEDTGNCKGWAFIDFTSIEHATAALTNPKNHRLDGRSLVVEYASPDAVRRGGGGPRPKADRPAAEARPGRGSVRGSRTDPGGRSEHRDDRGGHRGAKDDRGWWKGSREESAQDSGDVGGAAPLGARVEAPRGYGSGTGPGDGGDRDRDAGKEKERGGYKGVKGRSKPGAALALAKRESTAIVASQGKKITF